VGRSALRDASTGGRLKVVRIIAMRSELAELADVSAWGISVPQI
jgi:hypothetical protein